MVGQTISHYRVLSALGEGGMGVVYKAEDTKLKRTVALKFLQSSGDSRRLLREARTAASLNHPNVCAIYEVDEEHGFLAMEYIAGQTLKELIGGRPLPFGQAIELALQIGEGLRAAHANGIIHRDIKSGNVMVTASGQAKLMDFGLARDGDPDQVSRTHVSGTPGYMSPEQAAGGAVDERADIWALGIVLHEMLTGRVPVIGEMDPLPPALERVLRKALATNPANRYQHVADLLVDLRQARKASPGTRSRRSLIIGGGAAVASVAGFAAWFFLGRSRNGAVEKIESVAVLPLENLSGNKDQEYFSDGITDELIGEISRIASLRVISRTSVMRYKGARRSLQEIARELNVDAIVEGAVAQSGQRVRVSAQLIRARDERSLWSGRYERDLADVLALQSEVARAIASEVQIKLTPLEQTSLARTRRVSPEAYEAFLRGNAFLHRGVTGTARSIEFFKQAIQLDSASAEAHAGLAQALIYTGIFGFRSSAGAFQEAREAALASLKLDESNAGAHNALADVKKGYDWDMEGAEVEYKRALQLNPSHLLTRLWYAEWMTRMGRNDEALAESLRAIALDPMSPLSHNNRAMLLFRSRRYDEAIRSSQLALDLDSNFVNALWWQGASYAGKGDFAKAIALLTTAMNVNDGPMVRGMLGNVYARAGEKARALDQIKAIEAMSRQRYVSPADIAMIYAGLGDADRTFDWMEKAYRERTHGVHFIRSPYFDLLRSDPRYADLMKRVGLPV